jgi:hypothetical protein
MRKLIEVEEFKAKKGEFEFVEHDLALRKFGVAEVKAEDEDDRILTFTISTGAIDRDGDTINPRGWDLKSYRQNPVVLFAHNYHEPPVGKASKVWVETGGGKGHEGSTALLKGRVEFVSREVYPFAETIYQLHRGGFLKATSVGFVPKAWDWSEDEERKGGIDFHKQELLEFSSVPVPSNPEALQDAKAYGVDVGPLHEWAEKVLDSKEFVGVAPEQVERVWKETAGGVVIPISIKLVSEEDRPIVQAALEGMAENITQESLADQIKAGLVRKWMKTDLRYDNDSDEVTLRLPGDDTDYTLPASLVREAQQCRDEGCEFELIKRKQKHHVDDDADPDSFLIADADDAADDGDQFEVAADF